MTRVAAQAEVRTWTDESNRTWQGEFVRMNGASAVILVDGQEFSFPLTHLSAADRVFIFKLRRASATGMAPAPTLAPTPSKEAAPRVAVVNSADAAFDAYNAAFLVRANGETFYKKTLANDKRCGTWVGASEIQLAEDAYERNKSGARGQLVRDLTNTFLAKEGVDWSYDKWNDDIGWMMIACIRGYQITGNSALLNRAVTAWNMAYNRGWDMTYGGGIWENMDNVPEGGKCGLSNWPFVVAGCLIYQSTHDPAILAKCRAIYAWSRTNLFDTTTGRVHEQMGPKGQTGDDNVYNSGMVINAANILYKITKEDIYYKDALLAANHVVSKHPILHHNGRLETSWADQFVRGLGYFCRDNNLWDRYHSWFVANANAAWNSRRADKSVTWNDWTAPTALDDCTSFECLSAAVIHQVMPPDSAFPGAQ